MKSEQDRLSAMIEWSNDGDKRTASANRLSE
jgi:hypothetical protein